MKIRNMEGTIWRATLEEYVSKTTWDSLTEDERNILAHTMEVQCDLDSHPDREARSLTREATEAYGRDEATYLKKMAQRLIDEHAADQSVDDACSHWVFEARVFLRECAESHSVDTGHAILLIQQALQLMGSGPPEEES